MLGRDAPDRQLAQLLERVGEDLAARHVVLVERPDRIEVGHRRREQRTIIGESPEEVGREERPRHFVERDERVRKVQVRSSHELERPILEREAPVVLFDSPVREGGPAVTDHVLIAPVCHDGGFRVQPSGHQRRQGADDVGVLVRTDQPADVLEADHRVDLADDLLSGEGRTRIDQDRLVALLDQIDVASELAIGQGRTHPPDARRELDRLRDVDLDVAHGEPLDPLSWRR